MKNLLLLSTLLFSCLTLTACDIDEGGTEEIGENIDNAATDLGNSIEDACEDAKQGMNADDADC